MQPGSNAHPYRSQLVPNINGATDGSCRSVERGEHTVAGGLDLATAVSVQMPSDDPEVLSQQFVPPHVAQLGGQPGRVDDVGEQHGSQHAVVSPLWPNAGNELLDLGQDRLRVAGPDELVVSGQFDVSGSRN